MAHLQNPIIRKELIQASHSRWLYWLRTLLPLAAAFILFTQIYMVLRWQQMDWRTIAEIARPLFTMTAWMELIAFSLAGFLFGLSVVHREWVNRTVEVLCVTPLGRGRIIYGKLFSVVGRLMMLALSLLPIIGLSFHLGRIPREMAVGAVAVIIGSLAFFAAAGLMQSCMSRSTRGAMQGSIGLLVPWFLALILLDAYVFKQHPLLEGALSPRALYLVLNDRAPTGYDMLSFGLLSMGIHLGLAVIALLLAPLLFERSFRIHIGATRPVRPFARLQRLLRKRRRPLRDDRSPFVWQERGGPTRMLSMTFWAVYAIAFVITFADAIDRGHFRFLTDDEFYGMLFVTGLIVNLVVALLYGASVFAREKSHRRAAGLLLTGHPPRRFILAKVRALYRAMWLPICVVGGIGIGLMVENEPNHTAEWHVCFLMAQVVLLGPGAATVIGTAFSSVAKSPLSAVLGLLSSLVWLVMLYFVLGIVIEVFDFDVETAFIPFLILWLILLKAPRRWRPGLLGLALASSFLLGVFAAVAIWVALENDLPGDQHLITPIGTFIPWALVLVWWWMAVRFFDRGMSGQPAAFLRKPRD